MAAPKPIWVRQAEEAKLKSEAETAAAAKAAFDATFKALSASGADDPDQDDDLHRPSSPAQASRDAYSDADDDRPHAPPGPVDPSKSSAAGPGIAGGSAGAPATFTVVSKDRDSRRVPTGGARVRVRVSPAAGVGGDDLDGAVKDNGDGSYAVTYVVPKRGNYMVHVDLDGSPVMGSPFPVFFSASNTAASVTSTFPTTLPAVSSAYPNMVNQTMPNMPNYAGALSGAFPSLLGLIPAASTGASGGVVLPGVGASLGEICREHINGKCTKATDCSKLNHPPQQLLMSVLAATTSVGALSQAPMAPSAAAMAAAQAIMAAQALQAHAAQMQADSKAAGGESSGSADKTDKGDALKKMVQISNLSPLLTVDHIKQLFGYCGKVVDCTITDSKHIAYVEYSKQEEATAALALNNMDVGGRPLNVEMAKSLPPKTNLANSNLPMMMQQAVQLQQMQFQQALIMQQTIAAQQAAARAATMKSATEAAAARAAEISRKLKAEGFGGETVEEKDARGKSRSPSPSAHRSKSRSRSPIKYRRSRRSRSYSPPVRHARGRRSRSPSRSYHSKYGSDRSHRDDRDKYGRSGRRESDRSRDHYSSSSRRNRSRSISPRYKKSSRSDSRSPKRHKEESLSPSKSRRSARAGSRSPKQHKGSKLSPTRDHHSSHRSRRSRSRSQEKNRNSDKKDSKKSEMEDKKRKSDRGNRGDKDEKYLKDPTEEKKVNVSSVAHKRSSSASEDEMLNSNSKRSKHGAALEYDERKDEDRIEEDRRNLNSVRSKSEKRSLGNGDHEKQNHDTNRKTDNKSHDKDDSSRKDRKYREDESRHSRSSRHSSSRSHRSSRHSMEKYHGDITDQHKSKKSEEGSKSRKDDCLPDDTLSSDRRKVQSEDSPRRKHNQLVAISDVHGINHDTGVKLPNDFSEADQGIQEAQQVVHETDMSSAPRLEDTFLAQNKQDSSTVAGLNGRHEPGVDGAFVGTEESAI
uniref:RRM domain-containing protein n=1 Tax=Oryza punctata TaxID=4537 RepID=A0A0E0JD03_ORYPU